MSWYIGDELRRRMAYDSWVDPDDDTLMSEAGMANSEFDAIFMDESTYRSMSLHEPYRREYSPPKKNS